MDNNTLPLDWQLVWVFCLLRCYGKEYKHVYTAAGAGGTQECQSGRGGGAPLVESSPVTTDTISLLIGLVTTDTISLLLGLVTTYTPGYCPLHMNGIS